MENKLKISENTVVHCATEEDVKNLFELADKLNLKWQNGKSYLDVTTLSNFCYDLHKGGRGYKEYFVDRDYTVISAQDFIALHKEEPKLDLVVEAVREDLLRRSQLGIKKYGTTLADGNYTHLELLQHAYEEALDLANYLKTIIIQLKSNETH